MGVATFKGGIHPREGKELTKDKATRVLMPTRELVFPLVQHIGAGAKPVVAKGDKVLVGQIIAQAAGDVSANICSSVSGTVKSIEPRRATSGVMIDAIIIENDGEDAKVEGFGERRDYTKMTKEEIREAIKEAGIVGMGGAGFPTHVKLTPPKDEEIDYVIVNGAECEPYLTSDYRMMLEETERLVGGLKVILSLFPNAKGYISVEDNKPEAIRKLQQAVEKEERIEVKVLKTKYPQGAERKLIYATCNRKINSTMLPADAGCIVNNVDTVIAVFMAVCESTPLIRRIVTVTGDAVKEPANFNVRTGMSYEELLEAAGNFKTEPGKVISGGPMMGVALFDLNVPITKVSSALLCMTRDEVAESVTTNCIHCGRCVSVCPSRLVPQKLMQAVSRHQLDVFESFHGMECYECGSCSYICPAKIPLTQAFKEARRTVINNRRKQ